MGQKFGELARMRGIVYFKLSPHEQKAFAGAIKDGVPNMARRIYARIFRVTPPFMLAYALYAWAEEENKRVSRKNPKDFENDV